MECHLLMIDEEHVMEAELGSMSSELLIFLKEEAKKSDMDILPFISSSEMIFNILQIQEIKKEILKLQLKNLLQKEEDISILTSAIDAILKQKSYAYLKIIFN